MFPSHNLMCHLYREIAVCTCGTSCSLQIVQEVCLASHPQIIYEFDCTAVRLGSLQFQFYVHEAM